MLSISKITEYDINMEDKFPVFCSPLKNPALSDRGNRYRIYSFPQKGKKIWNLLEKSKHFKWIR